MSNIIEDGKGSGNKAQVDDGNRLHTSADTRSSLDLAIDDGRYFGVNTGYLTLTSDGQSAILHIRNDSSRDFFLKTFRLAIGPSTGGTGVVKLLLPLNITGGTILSGGNAAPVFNLNASSNNLFEGEALVGGEGFTATGGGGNNLLVPSDSTIYDKDAEAVIPRGFSASVLITPPAGNTSLEVQLLMTGYYLDQDRK